MSTFTSWWETTVSGSGGLVGEVSAAALVLLLLVVIWQAITRTGVSQRARTVQGSTADTLLTFIVAGMATATSAEAMWNFFHYTLHIDNAFMRAVMFSMYEAAMLVCALRARRAARTSNRSAGVENAAVWVMAGLSGVLAASAEHTFGARTARLAAPMVAAFLWERGLSEERKDAGKRTIHWRIGWERVLVRLGLAEAKERSVSDIDAHRRLTRLARAVARVRDLEETGVEEGWRIRRARRRVRQRMDAAVEHAGLTERPARQDALLAQLGALYNAQNLARLSLPAPWDPLAAPRPSVRISMLTPLAFMPRPEGPGDEPEPARRPDISATPTSPGTASVGSPGPEAIPEPDTGSLAPARAGGNRTPAVSADRPADKSSRSIDRSAFFAALEEFNGRIDEACAVMTERGLKAPARGYAYQLRKIWRAEKAQANGHLTRVK